MQRLLDRRMILEELLEDIGEMAQLGQGSLVDKEGFPRSDIDVYSIRHARSKESSLKAELGLVMKEIEERLPGALGQGKLSTKPFAVVTSVTPTGEAAGVLKGDKVVRLNDATCYADLTRLPRDDKVAMIRVLRHDVIHTHHSDSCTLLDISLLKL
jgi:26S proteasome non-ATPase regulatory subunit 9